MQIGFRFQQLSRFIWPKHLASFELVKPCQYWYLKGSLFDVRRRYPCRPADTVPAHILREAVHPGHLLRVAAHPGHLPDLRAATLRAHTQALAPAAPIRLVGRAPTPGPVTAAVLVIAALRPLIAPRAAHRQSRPRSRCIARE